MPTFRRQGPVDDHLQSIDEFKGYKKTELREVARLADRVEVGKGKILVREGHFGKELFVILSGTVEVTQNGRRTNVLGPGDFFGELAELTHGPREATVSALSDVGLLIIGRRQFYTMLKIPRFRDALLKRMASRLQIIDANARRDSMGKRTDASSPHPLARLSVS